MFTPIRMVKMFNKIVKFVLFAGLGMNIKIKYDV